MIIFGSNFFDSYQTSFAPINQQNFSSDYVIDVGDVLSVQTFGTVKVNKKLPFLEMAQLTFQTLELFCCWFALRRCY